MSLRRWSRAMAPGLARSTLAILPATPLGGTCMPIEPKLPPDLTSGSTISVAGKSGTGKGAEIVVNAAMTIQKYAADQGNLVNELNEKNNAFGGRFRVTRSCLP